MKTASMFALGLVLVVGSGFRILGAFAWLVERGFDFPFLTLIGSVLIAAIPGFGAWSSYQALAAGPLGATGSAVLIAPTLVGEVLVVVAAVGAISDLAKR